MTADRFINVLVTATLIEMMVAVGLGVSSGDVLAATKQWRLLLRAALANYLVVPAATVALLSLYRPNSMVAIGFVILAACPGAPYGPPFTAIAKGNVAASIGLMVMLALSSAVVAPLLLRLLLPLTVADADVNVDARRLIATLLATQLVPLFAGIGLRIWRPNVAARIQGPAKRLSTLLNLTAIVSILSVQYRTFLDIRLLAFVGMFTLLLVSLVAGWLLGGASHEERKSLALTTSLRNVGVSMVIASGNFPGTPALTAVLAYALVEVFGSLALALWWRGR